MDKIEISTFLINKNKQTRTGSCISCNKTVQWAKDRLAAHKRTSCPTATAEEKRLFAKRKFNSLDQQKNTLASTSPSTSTTFENSTINKELKNDIDMKLSNFFYRTGISLRLIESDAFKQFIKSLNPSYAAIMPSAKNLSGPLLDQQYNKCLTSMNEILSSHTNLTLMSDGWTNIRGDHVVNFCVKAPGEKPFFYTSINTTGIIQNAPSVAAAIIEIIEAIGSEKICSFVSDNAPVMRAAWKIIEEKYPHISANGCAAHAMNLLIKDISSTPEASKTIKEAEKIIKFIKNHHSVKAMFEEKRLAANITQTLSMPVSTRWYSCYTSMNNLQNSKYVLIMLADEAGDILKEVQPKSTSAAVLALIKSNQFWDRLAKLIKNIQFPSNVIGKLESEDAPLCLVYDYFGQLYNAYEDDRDIQQKIKNRLDFVFTTSIGLAFILTPKNAANGYFFNDDKIDFLASATDFANKIQPDIAASVGDELIAFMGEMSTLPERKKEVVLKMSTKNYWNIIGREKFPALYQIAKPISEMICSSATSERAWSTFRFIHSRLRNRLSNERVKKLVFLYINSVLMDLNDKNDYILEEGAILTDLDCDENVE